MSYLERNKLILAEMGQRAKLSRGRVLGRSDNSQFTELGSFESSVVGGKVYVGLKEYFDGLMNLGVALAEDLSLLRIVEAELPSLAPELPSFTGILVGMDSKPKGLLIEDFSRGGTRQVREMKDTRYTPEQLPMELEELIGPQRTLDELARVCFLVTDEDGKVHRRMGDFNTILLWMGLSKRFELFPMTDLLREGAEPYTLKMDYPF